MARRPGLGLASDLRVMAAGGGRTLLNAAASGGSRSSVVNRVNAARVVDPTSPFVTGEAFTPEAMAAIYGHDAAWAGAAQLVDGRIAGRCGGGGCNAPSCAHQYWNVALPCNEQNLQAYLFQAGRFVWAQRRLNQLVMHPPTPWNAVTNQVVAERAVEWGTWLSEVYKAIALLRWASNVRWELVTAKISLPFEPMFAGTPPRFDWKLSPAWFEQIARPGNAGSELIDRFMQQRSVSGRDPGGGWLAWIGCTSVLMEPPITWAFGQAGAGYDPDCRPWQGNTGDFGTVNALNWPLKVPSNAQDFAPMFKRWPLPVPTQPADRDPGGRWWGYEYQCSRVPGYMNVQPARAPSPQLSTFLRRGATLAPDALGMMHQRESAGGETPFDRVKEYGGSKMMGWDGTPYWEWDCSPLMQVLVAKTRAEAYGGLEFGTVISAGLSAWSEVILAQPIEMQGGDARTLEAFQAGLMQAQLNEAAAYVGAGFGAAAGLATALIPQPYGAIVGAVIAVIGAIVTALMGAAYDLGLARPDRPPCPAPPVLRMIEDPVTGACDFDAARRGAQEVLGKTSAITTLIEGGVVNPSAWLPVLEALSTRPMDPEPPVLPAPDAVPARSSVVPVVVGGLAAGAVTLGLLKFLRS